MKLCENRPEGFGPSSNISHPYPTTCFTDTILIPLPTWLYLPTLLLLTILTTYQTRKNFNPSTAHLRLIHRPTKTFSLRNVLSYLYYFLVIANILLQALEIVRLLLIHDGIGLLPFSYVGLAVAGFMHATDGARARVRGWVGANVLFVWVGGVVVSVVQCLGLAKQGFHGVRGRVDSKYHVSDQVLDVAVMAGVYAVIGLLELALWWMRPRIREERDELGEEMMLDARTSVGMK